MMSLVEDYEQARLPTQMVVIGWSFIAMILLAQGHIDRAKRIFCEQEEEAIRLCSPDRLLEFYGNHLKCIAEQATKAKITSFEEAKAIIEKASKITPKGLWAKIALVSLFKTACALLIKIGALLPPTLSNIVSQLAAASQLHIKSTLSMFLAIISPLHSPNEPGCSFMIDWFSNNFTWRIKALEKVQEADSIPIGLHEKLVETLLNNGHLSLYFEMLEQSPASHSLHYNLVAAVAYRLIGN